MIHRFGWDRRSDPDRIAEVIKASRADIVGLAGWRRATEKTSS
jgi:endonuclease/exonuclease/phosphatase family metal-dependent hydrolase